MSTESQTIDDLIEKLVDAAMFLKHYSAGPKEQAELEAARQTLLEKFEGDLKEARLQSSASLLRHQLDVAQIAWAGPSTHASEAADVIERLCNGLENYRNTAPWGDDDEEMLIEARQVVAGLREVPEQTPAQPASPIWLDPASAPKDGTLLCLQVEFEDGNLEDHPFSQVTIGHNSLSNTGVDEWAFAGWNWTHDCYTQGVGKVIGWLPLRYLGVTQPGDRHPDNLAVDRFADTLKAKMLEGRAKGRQGWETCPPAKLSTMLRHHVEKGDPRDVALFCMMLWHQAASIQSPVSSKRVYLVATGETCNGLETYTRHEALVPMADQEVLWSAEPMAKLFANFAAADLPTWSRKNLEAFVRRVHNELVKIFAWTNELYEIPLTDDIMRAIRTRALDEFGTGQAQGELWDQILMRETARTIEVTARGGA